MRRDPVRAGHLGTAAARHISCSPTGVVVPAPECSVPVNRTYNFLFRRLDAMIPLRKGLDAYATRQKVMAANIANSETPGYKASKVEFEEELKKAMESRRKRMMRTDTGHIPVAGGTRRLDRVQPQVVDSETPRLFNGVNNVDIDREMSRMATNQIQYGTASKLLSMRFRLLKASILGRPGG